MIKSGTMKNSKSKGSKKSRLTAARLAAVQTVYQMQTGEHSALVAARDFLDHYSGMILDGEIMLEPDSELYSSIVRGVEGRGNELREIMMSNIINSAHDVEDERKRAVEPLLESIMLCGIFELMAHHDTDAPIIISDYLHVTHAFYEKKEAGLVNGVLDKISSALRHCD